VALDGSQLSERILPYIEPLACGMEASVTLLRALAPSDTGLLAETVGGVSLIDGAPAAELRAIIEQMRRDTVTYLDGVRNQLAGQGFTVEYETPEGRAAEVIVQRARDLDADLIALTTHGRTGIARAVLGSVASEVLQHASCAVLLVRAA
jgi:nucleotide-binding universal stress UspA family protein